jgi:hypothetical protein
MKMNMDEANTKLNQKPPAAYVKLTDSGVELVGGLSRLWGTLDVLHRATVEVIGTGEQFEVRRDPRGKIVMA